MTSPVKKIRVECPRCGSVFEDWTRGSVNLNLDDFDEDYLRRCSTATCPRCGFVVELVSLTVHGDTWRVGGRPDSAELAAEVERMEAELGERFGDQAASWELA